MISKLRKKNIFSQPGLHTMIVIVLQHARVIPEDRLENLRVFGLDTFLQRHTLYQVTL